MAWTSAKISSIATRIYFILIILQIPLFRVPCRKGMCDSPLEVTCSQLVASEVFPPAVVKALLYPGAVAKGLAFSTGIPSWHDVLQLYNITDANKSSPLPDLRRLEVLVGSYFAVAGAVVGLVKPGRMTLFGVLLLVWGLVKEGFLGKPQEKNSDPAVAIFVYPTILIALVCAFASVRYDLKKASRRSNQPRPSATPLQSSTKSKLK
ncbi:tail fiber [Wolffia australiana]